MIINQLRRPLILLFCAFLTLSACESAEERAERFYQSGLALLEEGDVPRALVEFRNVFKLNGKHRGARQTYARIQRKNGSMSEAYGQYLRLVEQYPEDLEGQRALAEMAFDQGNWEEVERHTIAGIEIAPDDPALQILNTVLAYRQAKLDKNRRGWVVAIEKLRGLLKVVPDSQIGYQILIGHLMGGPKPLDALSEIETALKPDENNFRLQTAKLQLLNLQDDRPAVEEQLKKMQRLFPDNQMVQGTMLKWYTDLGRTDDAEAFLRELAEESGKPAEKMAVVRFIRATRGNEAALEELNKLIAGNPDNNVMKSLRAALSFDMGQRDEALTEFATILENAPSSEDTRGIKIAYAHALSATGNNIGARAQVEEILAEDQSNVAALKLRAGWLIEDDKPGDAILALREALNQAPRDPEILTLMANAHMRDGSRELAGERLSLAVEVSQRAPAESLRYAKFLIGEERLLAAESVLIDALRLSKEHLGLLDALSQLYIRMDDRPRAHGVLKRLRSLGTPDATRIADRLQTRLLLEQGQSEDAISFLEGLVDKDENAIDAKAIIVRTFVASGETEKAAQYLDEQLVSAPDDKVLLLLRAGIHVISGKLDAGEAIYRKMIEENPGLETPVLIMHRILIGSDRGEEAKTVLNDALKVNPNSMRMNLLNAQMLERAGDIDGAIAVYEHLYGLDPNSPVLANNLASMITSHRDDDASLQRAYAIARRLRGTTVPAFQDTYGWIEYRRGNFDEALTYLEPAAKGLAKDPLAQFHLGMAYLALDKKDEARQTLEHALEMAGDSPLPQFQTAREALAKAIDK